MNVPLCDIQAQYRALESQLQEAVNKVLKSGQVIGGPEVTALEEETARYSGAHYGVGCSSGSDALLLALAALGVGQTGQQAQERQRRSGAAAGDVPRGAAVP